MMHRAQNRHTIIRNRMLLILQRVNNNFLIRLHQALMVLQILVLLIQRTLLMQTQILLLQQIWILSVLPSLIPSNKSRMTIIRKAPKNLRFSRARYSTKSRKKKNRLLRLSIIFFRHVSRAMVRSVRCAIRFSLRLTVMLRSKVTTAMLEAKKLAAIHGIVNITYFLDGSVLPQTLFAVIKA